MVISAAKIPLDPGRDGALIRDLELEAVRARKMIVEMGYRNRIRLHYGALMSMVEIVIALYLRWLNVRPEDPQWTGRDRFVLSKGHGAPSLYVALWRRGFFEARHFQGFRRLHSILQGHPDRRKTPGVDSCSGSLGQGLPVACGMALGARIEGAEWGVYALISDGECNEGSIWEAAQIASNLGLGRLKVMMDWNGKSSYGLMAGRNDVAPLPEKWRAFNWEVLECDGHDFVSITQALAEAESVTGGPAIVLCRTTKGKGIPYVENYPTKPNILLSDDEYRACLEHLEVVEGELLHG